MSKIFISYRREDSKVTTDRLYERLKQQFGKRNVFRDIDNIHGGVDFRAALDRALHQAKVVLVIIGPTWTTIRDAQGRQRLTDPNDFVRLEVEAALRLNVPVIPVQVQGAIMPTAAQLPPTMTQLPYQNAVQVRGDPDFSNDIRVLLNAVARYIPNVVRARFVQTRLLPVISVVLALLLVIALIFRASLVTFLQQHGILPTPVPESVYVASTQQAIYAIDAQTGKQRWQYTAPGDPLRITADNATIFVGVQGTTAPVDHLIAFNTANGKVEWDDTLNNSGSNALTNIVVSQGRVYVGYGKLYALDENTGALVWQTPLSEPIEDPFPQGAIDLVFQNQTLYTSGVDTLYAVNAESGTVDWMQTPASAANASSDSPATLTFVIGANAAVVSTNKAVYAYDAGDGHALWNHTMDNPAGSASLTPPVFDNGQDFVQLQDGYLYGLNANGGEAWVPVQLNPPITTAPVVYKDVVYAANYAIDVHTGTPSNDQIADGGLVAPIIAHDTIYDFANDTVSVTNLAGISRWQTDLTKAGITGGIDNASLVGNILFVSGGNAQDSVIALDANGGNILWSYPAGAWQFIIH